MWSAPHSTALSGGQGDLLQPKVITLYCRRGGKFGVIEVWVEGCQLVEVLTPAMQAEYLETVTIPNWQAMIKEFEAQRLAQAA